MVDKLATRGDWDLGHVYRVWDTDGGRGQDPMIDIVKSIKALEPGSNN